MDAMDNESEARSELEKQKESSLVDEELDTMEATKKKVPMFVDVEDNKVIKFNTHVDSRLVIAFPASMRDQMMTIRSNLLVILLFTGMLFGLICGFLLKYVISPHHLVTIFYLEFPGNLLLNMLESLIMPLVLTSVVSSLSRVGRKVSSHIGVYAILYFLGTTFVAVLLGTILVLIIRPGVDVGIHEHKKISKPVEPFIALVDLVLQAFPNNFITASFEQTSSRVETTEMEVDGQNETVKQIVQTVVKTPNVMGYITLSIVLGVLMSMHGLTVRPLIDLFEAANFIILRITTLVIWFTPLGIMFLVMSKIIKTESLLDMGKDIGLYLFTVLLALSLHCFVVLPCIYWFITKRNPITFGCGMVQAILTAWGTSSSFATLPVTMDCLVEKNKLHINIVRFVAPIGATVNMDGTAIHHAIVSIFIAQVNDIDLDFVQVVVICLTATISAIGTPGTPQATLIGPLITMSAAGIPTEHVTLVLAIDWFLDRFRTAVNVVGDAYGTGIVDYYFEGALGLLDKTESEGSAASDA